MTTIADEVVVDAGTLRDELAGTNPPALLDVRWALGDRYGEAHYREGHLPGAVYVDLDTELAGPPSSDVGRHPLPDIADLERWARGWGLRQGTPVVVYDALGGTSAARAWWLLRWGGVADVRILDGGLAAWIAAGGPVETGSRHPSAGDVVLTPGNMPTLDADAAAAVPGHGRLIDARAAERYRGDTEPVDPRAGHVPGAISLPTGDNLDPDGRFLPPDRLRARFAAAGVDAAAGPIGVYCGSGVTAAHEIAALRLAGIDAALYPGSWSAWSADTSRPVAVGDTPA